MLYKGSSHRVLGGELLESRLMLSVTVDDPTNHEVTSAAQGYGGVVLVRYMSGGQPTTGHVSGVLLSTGRHVLTAAHNVGPNATVRIEVDLDGNNTLNTSDEYIDVVDIIRHTHFVSQGAEHDLAILELAHDVDVSVPRYEIYREFDELGQVGTRVGYGRSGQFQVDPNLPVKKRFGTNSYDELANNRFQLLYDFDYDDGVNNYNRMGTDGNDGQGNNEVLSADRDSGSPIFINGQIAGISVRGLTSGWGPGIVGTDIRISKEAWWIDSVLGEAPTAPRVDDVVVKGSSWQPHRSYSFADRVEDGTQLKPLPRQNADTIEIYFNKPVALASDGSDLRLTQTVRNSNGSATTIDIVFSSSTGTFQYDTNLYIGRWTFSSALADGKYAIHLTGVTGAGLALDGDWDNRPKVPLTTPPTPLTLDNYQDDLARPFVVGDGSEGSAANEFRFHFALLVGDLDGNHVVDANDLNPTVLGDVNGDRAAGDQADIDVVTGRIGQRSPLLMFAGPDFNDDEVVNAADLAIWVAQFGSLSIGDVDGDADVDGGDFLALTASYGLGAWAYDEADAFAAVVGDYAPWVANVIISGSASLHPAFLFDSVDGSGTQLKTVPVGAADTISIVFSENVNVGAGHMMLIGLYTGNLPQFADFNYDPLTYTATWRFEGWRPGGDQYVLALSDAVTDEQGNRLDGEWTNPAATTTTNSAVSEFPSGDGTPGGWFNFVMALMPGDANLDGIVNLSDYSILSSNYNVMTGRLFTHGDFNGDGATNVNDYGALSSNYGVNRQSLWLLADFDGDYDVDGDDLEVIGNNAGMTGATWADGDLDGDGEVTVDDFDLAMAQFGLDGLFIDVVA